MGKWSVFKFATMLSISNIKSYNGNDVFLTPIFNNALEYKAIY